MSMFATPKVPEAELGKEKLVDALIVVKVLEYDPAGPSRFSPKEGTPTLKAHLTVVDGPLAGKTEPEWVQFGNLARQIGEALDVGTQAPGRIETGKSANGRDWFGIRWATSDEDAAAAEAALKGQQAPKAAEEIVQRSMASKPAAEPVADEEPPF